ncbi:SAM-dependent methyltransferase [Planomonospora sp. ID82291]|uniref:SAM-dependent methyltransferase n=1 Tax=Planomonospora sp. ID82291 TaxID=2738136 RepID=UPI0018C3CF3E|nr:SAM-dependent methyltransferase [Planomonospora sp. ID82291]MBG0818430.1 SAM-dependent methyltransferase [Planomonospora sp. ID82291]
MTEHTSTSGFDPHTPAVYRVYQGLSSDGKDAFAADREVAAQLTVLIPAVRQAARANLAFLEAAVRAASQRGVRQFLDLGAGLPRPDRNLHDVARTIEEDIRFVYLDHEKAVITHWQGLLYGEHGAGLAAVLGDALHPDEALALSQACGLIDPAQPTGLIMGALAHFWDDGTAAKTITSYMEALTAGSMLIFSHATSDGHDPEQIAAAKDIYPVDVHPRTAAQIQRLLTDPGPHGPGLELLNPGLVSVHAWPKPPEEGVPPGPPAGLAAVGVKP